MPPFVPLSRRALLGLGLALGLCAALPVQAETELRIGYQKSSTLIALLKARGTLEKALAAQDIRLSWHEFASGQPLLEALNVGNLDLSADVADTVPVFAQAAGAHLAYFAQEAPSPAAQAILVRGDSPLRGLADLKEGRGDQGRRQPLPAARRAGPGRPEVLRHPAGLPDPGRWPRRLRERQGGCLGDLGAVPQQRPAPAITLLHR